MAVHVDINAQFDDRSVMVSANDLKRNVERAGDETGQAWGEGFTRGADGRLRDSRGRFIKAGQDLGGDVAKGMGEGFEREIPKFKAGIDGAVRATRSFHDEQKRLQDLMRDGSSYEVVSRQAERTANAHSLAKTAAKDAGDAFKEFENASKSLSNAAGGAADSVGSLGGAMGKVAGPAAAIAIVGLASAAVELAGVAASAAQSLWLIPAAAGAAGAAIGTIALATYGFSDALKAVGDPAKFGEALKQLSPNAQQAALSIQALMPAFTDLRKATSEAFFANVGPQLNQLTNQLLPTIQTMTTGIAGAFNQAFSGVAQQLMAPQTQQAIQTFTTNVVSAFQKLAPAVAPMVSAFAEIAKVGSSFLPGLAQAATQAAQAFSSFISQKAATGELQRWLSEGLDTLKQLVPVAIEFGKAFMSLAPLGQAVLPDIVTALKSVDSIMPAIGVAALLLGPSFGALEATIGGVGKAFGAIEGIVKNVANSIIPTINLIGETLSNALAPVRAAAALVGLNIPAYSPIAQITSGDTGNGTPGINRTSRGGSTLATAGLPGVPAGGYPLPAASGQWWHGSGVPGSAGYGWGNPPPPGSGGSGSGPKLPTAPVVPYNTSLPPGFANLPQTASIYSAESSYMDANTAMEDKRARLQQLQKSNQATAAQIQAARNDVITAEHTQHEAELRLYTARDELYKKNATQMNGYANQLSEFGVKLEQDLGISKGLAGIADNLVRFLGNLALAPEMAKLNALANAPGQAQGGFGLMGMMGAQGVFGPQYTAAGQAAAAGGGSASAIGPAALQPGGGVAYGAATGGGSSTSAYTGPAAGPAQGGTYGLPGGTNTGGYGTGTSATFPDWAIQLGKAFGVTPSTYPGHQESDRHEAGYAPNPQHQNRGIDWSGPTASMQKFADYLKTIPQDLEQVIWNGAGVGSGDTVEIAGGRPQPGYFSDDLAGHGNHVHTRQSMPIPLPVSAPQGGQGFPLPLEPFNPFGPPGLPDVSGTAWANNQAGISLGPAQAQPGIGPGPLQGTPGTAPGSIGPFGAPPSVAATQGGLGSSALTPLGTPGGPGAAGWGAGSAAPGGAGGPGVGPTPIGGGPGLSGTGKGGIGMTEGGSLDTALGLAASAVPGLGQAAQTGAKLASRAIQYGGQVAGIMTQGALDTFLPFGGSELASKNWITRMVGGLAGAAPALPNMAGKAASPLSQPQQQPGQQGQGGPPPINVTYNNNQATEDRAGADLTNHLSTMYQSGIGR